MEGHLHVRHSVGMNYIIFTQNTRQHLELVHGFTHNYIEYSNKTVIVNCSCSFTETMLSNFKVRYCSMVIFPSVLINKLMLCYL